MSLDSADTHVVDLLPPYWAGTLGALQAKSVHAHLTTCAECRSSLAAYAAIGEGFRALQATMPSPSPDTLTRVWGMIDALEAAAVAPVPLTGTPALLPTQPRVWLPRLPRRLWIGVGLATALAGIMACGAPNPAMGGRLLSYAVPLVAALAIASVARPRGAVTSVRDGKLQVLAGSGLGLGYVVLLALLASAALALVRGGDVGALTLGWLGPTVLLAAASLLGSRLTRPTAGAAGACSLCFLHALFTIAGVESGSTVLATVLRSLWATNPVALALAGLLVLGSVAVPSRAR